MKKNQFFQSSAWAHGAQSVLAASTLILVGCATFRGMPSHGGGKRFDEEQRVVSASIRHAAESMDFSKIKTRKIALEVTGLETSGTGQAFYPGLGQMNGYYDWFDQDQKFDFGNMKYGQDAGAAPNNLGGFIKDNADKRDNLRWVPNFEFNPSLRSNNNITRQDVDYLQKVLEMRLRHDGFQIVPLNQCDAYLVVLVDALGTNLSRKDYLLAFDDDLAATCEMTYYAINPRSQNVLCAAKAVASESKYLERNIRFSPIQGHARSVKTFDERIAPLPTKAGGEFTGGRSANANVYVNPVRERADDLVQEAEVAIMSNDADAAKKAINALRKISPNHPNLQDLQQRLQEL